MWDSVVTLHTVQDDSSKRAMRPEDDRRFGYKCFSKADRRLAAYSDMYGGISTVLIPCSTFLFSSLFLPLAIVSTYTVFHLAAVEMFQSRYQRQRSSRYNQIMESELFSPMRFLGLDYFQ